MYAVILVAQFDTGCGNHVCGINIKIIIPEVMVKLVQPMVVTRKEKLLRTTFAVTTEWQQCSVPLILSPSPILVLQFCIVKGGDNCINTQ